MRSAGLGVSACLLAWCAGSSVASAGAGESRDGTGIVVAAVGDVCDALQQCARTAAVIAAVNPARLILAGDNAYVAGTLAEYNNYYDPNYGPFKARTHPVPGNHEYVTAGAAGYFDYFNGVGVFDGPAIRAITASTSATGT